MEEYIYIGKIVNTHGIKGEIRILSDFEYKDKVFIKDMPIYIGRKKELEIINSYRHHKNFEMITMKNYTNINEVLKYKGLYVYIKREDLLLSKTEYLDDDYVGLKVIVDNNEKGTIKEIRNTGINNKIIVIEYQSKEVLIPFQSEFIISIDINKKEIVLNPIKGMF